MEARLRVAGWGMSLLAFAVAFAAAGGAQQGFNQVAGRQADDPATVARGKTLYGINCQACHGSDLRGGDIGGPNLLRSSVAMLDRSGENIVPIIQGARQAQGMPKIGIGVEDSQAVAAYVRSVIGTIGGQGKPPGQEKELNIVVGDAARGHAYFTAHCASCHTAEGDLSGIATRYAGPRQLQTGWIEGAPPRNAARTPPPAAALASATITLADGQTVSGLLVHLDDFLVAVRLPDGTRRSFRRADNTPAVQVHDPVQAHRTMLPQYTDADIHDVTAYLVTLR